MKIPDRPTGERGLIWFRVSEGFQSSGREGRCGRSHSFHGQWATQRDPVMKKAKTKEKKEQGGNWGTAPQTVFQPSYAIVCTTNTYTTHAHTHK